MNSEERKLDEYQRIQINTASPGKLILMLYNGAIKFLTQAKKCHSSGDGEGFGNAVIRAENIIAELQGSLNLEQGGEIAKNLFSLYTFMNSTLTKANLNDDVTLIDNVLVLLTDLRDGWEEMLKKVEGTTVRQQVPARSSLDIAC